jgi:hypothetical protein
MVESESKVSKLNNFGGKVRERQDKRVKQAGTSITFSLSVDLDVLNTCMKKPHGDRSKTIVYYIVAGLKSEGLIQ